MQPMIETLQGMKLGLVVAVRAEFRGESRLFVQNLVYRLRSGTALANAAEDDESRPHARLPSKSTRLTGVF